MWHNYGERRVGLQDAVGQALLCSTVQKPHTVPTVNQLPEPVPHKGTVSQHFLLGYQSITRTAQGCVSCTFVFATCRAYFV